MTFLTGILVTLVAWFLADTLIVALLLTNSTLRCRVISTLKRIQQKSEEREYLDEYENEEEVELTDPIAKEVAEYDLRCDSCGYGKVGQLSEVGDHCEHCNEGFYE